MIQDLENEIWKPVKDFEGIYEVSNMGRVKSLPRKGSGGRDYPKIMAGGLSNGYHSLTLCNKGKMKISQVHRLVAFAFIPNPENKKEVNHINCVKTDNRLENLEWVTPSENILHGLRNGIMNTAKGSQKKNAKFTEEEVRLIKIRLKKGEIGYRMAKELGVSKEIIASIRTGRTWKHVTI